MPSSTSSSSSDSQHSAFSVLLGDTQPCFGAVSSMSLEADARNGCSSSCAAVGRSLGFLVKHLDRKFFASGESHSGISGTASVYPIRWTAEKTSSMSLHGTRPVAISMIVQPRAHTSAAGPCSSPRATSGAMNAGVPPIGRSESVLLAHPKSASLARPSAPTMMFLALTSPCTSEFPWSALATSAAYALMARSARRPPLLAASSASDPPGANSRNSWYSPPAAARDPRQGTMCGEQSPDMTRPSRRSCSAPPSPAADLTASSSPDASSDASHTTAPDAPRPSVRSRLSCFCITAAASIDLTCCVRAFEGLGGYQVFVLVAAASASTRVSCNTCGKRASERVAW
ncbi:hypothetical protein DAI22_01g292300 [Oryza sativa Japonica Group]|nr:hypothetical protein DAI22_01g292300 [Oryza sativa Japonica Group]